MLGVLIRLPLLPVTGVVRIAELIADEADRQLSDPMVVRRRLEEAEQARAAGSISAGEFDRIQREAIAAVVRER